MPRITKRLAAKAEEWSRNHLEIEVCGIFFFPDHIDRPEYIPLQNHSEQPYNNAILDYDDIEEGIVLMYGGVLEGEISIFHSHPQSDMPPHPSHDDLALALKFEQNMDGHPYWRPCTRHTVFAPRDGTWWWHDFNDYGQIGWEFPE